MANETHVIQYVLEQEQELEFDAEETCYTPFQPHTSVDTLADPT